MKFLIKKELRFDDENFNISCRELYDLEEAIGDVALANNKPEISMCMTMLIEKIYQFLKKD